MHHWMVWRIGSTEMSRVRMEVKIDGTEMFV